MNFYQNLIPCYSKADDKNRDKNLSAIVKQQQPLGKKGAWPGSLFK